MWVPSAQRPDAAVTATRSYIAALGSSVALLGAVVLACAALSGMVGAGGFPEGSGDAGVSQIFVDSETPAADLFAAADPLFDAPDAPDAGGTAAAAEQRGTDRGQGQGAGADADGADDPGAENDGAATGTPDAPDSPDTGGGSPAGDDPAEEPPSDPAPPPAGEPPAQAPAPAAPTGGSDEAGPLGTTVEGGDQLVTGVTGSDPGLSEVTAPVTGPVDDVVGGLLGSGDAAPAAAP